MVEGLPERPCGDCSVCCTHMSINAPGFTKAPGLTCQHCRSSGCGIYESRPDICRDYRCAWKYASWLRPDMRPDRSGIVIDFTECDDPAYELEARLFAYRDAADFERNPVPDVISSLIENRVLVYIARPGPTGLPGAKTAMNAGLGEAIRTRDLNRFMAELRAGVRAASSAAARG